MTRNDMTQHFARRYGARGLCFEKVIIDWVGWNAVDDHAIHIFPIQGGWAGMRKRVVGWDDDEIQVHKSRGRSYRTLAEALADWPNLPPLEVGPVLMTRNGR